MPGTASAIAFREVCSPRNMTNASRPGAVLRKKCCEEDEEDEVEGGIVILYVDVKLLVLCAVKLADLAWAGERERVLAMAGSRIWVDIARFGLLGRLGIQDAGIIL